MLQQRLVCIICLTAIVVPCAAARADEPVASGPAGRIEARSASERKTDAVGAGEKDAKAATDQTMVGQLIEQLDSADFAKREEACGKLAAKGLEAIPALEKAAAKGDLEVSSRALGVLGKLLDSPDEKTAKAAEKSLRSLADGESPAAARKAKSILEKNDATANNRPFPPGGNIRVPMGGGLGMGRIIINGGMLQIGGGAAVKSISVSNTNGVRRIKATDGDKTVKIEDDPANGVKIEQTDKVNGKVVTKKYEAKSIEELKKKEPEGYRIYREYDQPQGNGGFNVQMGGVLPIQPGLPIQPVLPAIPAIPAPLPFQPAPAPAPGPVPIPIPIPAPAPGAAPAAPAASTVQIDTARMRLKVIAAQLESLEKNESLKTASPEQRAEVRKQIDEVTRRLEELRKQIDNQ